MSDYTIILWPFWGWQSLPWGTLMDAATWICAGRESIFIYNVLWLSLLSKNYSSVCVYVPVCAQSCLTLCNPMDCDPSECGSSVHGIFQARILEWVATSSSTESFWTRDQTHVSWISYIGRQILYPYATWEAYPCATVLLSVLFLSLGRGTRTSVRSEKTILVH